MNIDKICSFRLFEKFKKLTKVNKNKFKRKLENKMTNLVNVEEKAIELGNDLETVNRELKRIASAKCRFIKQKGRKDYEEIMNKILAEEQLVKEVKQLLIQKPKPVTEFEQSDVDKLDYDETIKAIKSIQSKKSRSVYLTAEPGDNDEYRNAVRIEEMLLKHKDNIKPVDEAYIRKSDLQAIIETIESNHELTNERIVEMLSKLM